MTSKRLVRTLLLSAAMAVVSVPALAPAADDPKPAQPAPGGSGRFNPADRLKNYRDQFEGINLNEDQMKKIDGFIETAEVEVKKASNPDDREARSAAFAAIRKLDEDVQSVLTDPQKTALRAKRQSMMVDRMKQPYANPELKLTDEQSKKIDAIFTDLKKEMATVDTSAGDRREAFGKIFKMAGEARQKIDALLTEDQKKLIPKPQFGRRSRGGSSQDAPKPPSNN